MLVYFQHFHTRCLQTPVLYDGPIQLAGNLQIEYADLRNNSLTLLKLAQSCSARGVIQVIDSCQAVFLYLSLSSDICLIRLYER